MKVRKTTFDEEQAAKDEAFLKLSPLERLEAAYKARLLMYRQGVDYSLQGKKVTVKRFE
ncbi:MAG: hypothetical protein HC859_12550 [Bacteroidia bacterium]|nr:hypothetical protein [Bacteroidia bacterium]